MPLPISIIIPAYENQTQLDRAVSSVLEQDFEGEIIIIDDASPNPIQVKSTTNSRVETRLIRRDLNGGAGAARNTGIDTAQCSLITFLDSDDYLLPGTLRSRVEFAFKNGIQSQSRKHLTISCGWHEFDGEGAYLKTRIPRPPTSAGDFCLGCWFCPGSTIISTKAAFSSPEYRYDEALRRLEDYDLFLRYADRGGRLVVDETVGVGITKTHNKNVSDVLSAIEHLAHKWCGKEEPDALVRRTSTYLNYELAKLRKDQGHLGSAFWALAKSYAASPRFGIYPGPGWTEYIEQRKNQVSSDNSR